MLCDPRSDNCLKAAGERLIFAEKISMIVVTAIISLKEVLKP